VPVQVLLALGMMLLGALAAAGWTRLSFVRAQPTFRCKLRWPDGSQWTPRPWPRRKVRAAWVHDVLLVQRGIVRPRTLVLAAAGCDQAVRTTCRVEVRRLGTHPVVLLVRLDDGRTVEVAARQGDTGVLAGPFLTAAIRNLPRT
jgi:hypothetical protein